jgi:hypothetical protein
MGGPAKPIPVYRPRNPEIDLKTQVQQREQAIANLAYALWQRRGCPDSSPEEEWREAEQILRTERPSMFAASDR